MEKKFHRNIKTETYLFFPELLGTEWWQSSQSCDIFIFGVNSLLEVINYWSIFV